MADLWRPKGGVLVESSAVSHPSPPVLTPSLGPAGTLFQQQLCRRAERAAEEIIYRVQPTLVSEENRKEVIEYVQRLFKNLLNCEVFPFGSVPLKTYLPDGDIDLTAFCSSGSDEALAADVSFMLSAEDRNPATEFVVKDVQVIHAEVKLVKCLVDDIVVDISFNQIGGLCTLCFLEEIDCLIGKDHLFKRSIILIKAWCYYESRILGAHHSLISTYALETLVLYIFHLFHASVNGPLAVLYKFLHYYSKFDWETYGVSLQGPVLVSSLPDIVAERPENGGGELLLKDDFLRRCLDRYSVPSSGIDCAPKSLNIIDPLKVKNNLGRSVNKGNFLRIRSAFGFGARKLEQILSQPEDNIAEEVHRFFTNSPGRYIGHLRDGQDPLIVHGINGLVPEISPLGTQSTSDETSGRRAVGASSDRDNAAMSMSAPQTDLKDISVRGEHQGGLVLCTGSPRTDTSTAENATSVSHLSGDAKDLASSVLHHKSSRPLPNESPHAPHMFLSHKLANDSTGNGDLDGNLICPSTPTSGKVCCQLCGARGGNSCSSCEQEKRNSGIGREFSTSVPVTAPGSPPESVKSLSDLAGDFDSHLLSLHYGRSWFEYPSSMCLQSMHRPLPPQFPWDAAHAAREPLYTRQMHHMNGNDGMPRSGYVSLNNAMIPGSAFPIEELPKPRGTGSYIPQVSPRYQKDRNSTRGRNNGAVKSPRGNGRGGNQQGRGPHARSSSAPSEVHSSYHRYGGTPPPPDWHEADSPRRRMHPGINGRVSCEEGVPSGCRRSDPPEVSPANRTLKPDLVVSGGKNSGLIAGGTGVVTAENAERVDE